MYYKCIFFFFSHSCVFGSQHHHHFSKRTRNDPKTTLFFSLFLLSNWDTRVCRYSVCGFSLPSQTLVCIWIILFYIQLSILPVRVSMSQCTEKMPLINQVLPQTALQLPLGTSFLRQQLLLQHALVPLPNKT